MTDDATPAPRVLNPPERIWLVYGDLDADALHATLATSDDVLWAADQQFDADVPYVRADIVDDLQAALHATDLDRLRAMSAADVGTVMHRQTVAQRDAAWADSERLRTAIDRARSIVTTCALATGHLWPDDGIAAQLADALAHTAHALDAATRPQPGMMQHHLRVAAQDADAVGTAGLIAARRWEAAS